MCFRDIARPLTAPGYSGQTDPSFPVDTDPSF